MDDTVFDKDMKVVFSRSPRETEMRLNEKHPPTWTYVLVGDTQKILTVVQYINRETYAEIVETLTEAFDRQDTRPYKGVARKLFIEKIAQKIVDSIR